MATRADKPVHQPSEKHTLDEVLKSLQDLVRNDFDSPPAPAARKARVKEPARRHADDEHFGTTEAIGELMASLAALTGDEAPTTPATEPDDSPEALPLIDVDELQDTSDQLRFEPAPEVPPPRASPRVEAAAAARKSPAKAGPLATTITVEPEAPVTPAGWPAAEPALEPEIIDIEAAPPVEETAESVSGEADAESIEFGGPAPEPGGSGDAAEADAPAAGADALMPVTDFEAPSMELETLAFDALETGDAARPDDSLLSVSNFEAPSIELDALPPLDLDVSAAQPDSPLIPATDFEAPSLELDALSLEPEAPAATLELAGADKPLTAAPARKPPETRKEAATVAGGSKSATAHKPLALAPDTAHSTTPIAPVATGIKPAAAAVTASPDSAGTRPPTNAAAAKAATPNRVSLPPSAVIKKSNKTDKPKPAPPVAAKAAGDRTAAKPSFRPDSTGVRSGAVPRPTGIPKAVAGPTTGVPSPAARRAGDTRPASGTASPAASQTGTAANRGAAQPAVALPGGTPPGGQQQDLALPAPEPVRDFAATVPIEPYFVEPPAAAKPPAAATTAPSSPRTAAAAPSDPAKPAKPVAATPAATSPAGTQPVPTKPADITPAHTKPAGTRPAAGTKTADANLLPPAATAAAPATTLQAAMTAAALSADTVNVNWDDIPVLKDAVELEAAKGGPVDAARARKVAIQVAARLNVELRRAGKRSLNSAVVTRLARLIHEELAPSRANVDNNKAKKS